VDKINFIKQYCATSSKVIASISNQGELISSLVEDLATAIKNGGRVYSCGNGGSACDAMHLTEELVARYLRERPGIPAHHLIDPSGITCWANDYEFDTVFQRQVETLVTEKDFLFAFSTSGNSKNIVLAAEAAKKIGAKTVAMTGKDGGLLKETTDFPIIIESEITSHIQEAHINIVHIVCDLLEQKLFFN